MTGGRRLGAVRVWLRDGIISEEIDGEVIMIDLGTGIYYSLRGSAVPAWRALRTGATPEEIVTVLADRYRAVSPGEVQPAVERFFAQLEEEGLLSPVDSRASDPMGPLADSTNGDRTSGQGGTPGTAAGPFVAPEFERYDDMAHVIQMDPVHDIDPARGWPNVANSR